MMLLDSIRRRLVASMMLLFALGLGGAIVARPFEGSGGLLSRLDVDLIQEPYQDIIVLLMFSVATIGITLLVSGWSLRSLREASQQAACVDPRHPEVRIATDRLPREIRPLASAVNAALDRMTRAYDAERRFVADAAHELRTPLTVLSLRLQQARASGEPDWAQVDQDLAQVSRVVSQLLDLARKEAGVLEDQRSIDEVNMGRVIREAAALILPLADAAGRDLEIDVPDHLPVLGRAGDLRDMLRNLLENALVHGAGTIRVVGRLCGGEPVQVLVNVADQGTALYPADREAMFDRFRKADAASSGSGLGLAIVREVARAHGGTVRFASGAEAVLEVLLPAHGYDKKTGTIFRACAPAATESGFRH